MTQEQLDNIGFALVIARTNLKQMAAVATAFQQHESANEFSEQEKRFEAIAICIQNGDIVATNKRH